MARPITLSLAEAHALREGRLRELRRPLSPQPAGTEIVPLPDGWGFDDTTPRPGQPTRLHGVLRSPYGPPGDRLWGRESHAIYGAERQQVEYRASPLCGGDPDGGWRSPPQMPRWASRFLLEVVATRLERLQAIDQEGALASGVRFTDFGTDTPPGSASLDRGQTYHPFKSRQHPGYHLADVEGPEQCHQTARGAFAGGWEAAHGAGAWEANPWVWVLEVAVAPALSPPGRCGSK